MIWKALNFRRQNRQLLLEGNYMEVKANGRREQNVFAFTRRHGRKWMLVAVPRWLARPKAPLILAHMGPYWGASHLVLPPEAPARWMNVLTGEAVTCFRERGECVLPLRNLFRRLPAALLAGGGVVDDEK